MPLLAELSCLSTLQITFLMVLLYILQQNTILFCSFDMGFLGVALAVLELGSVDQASLELIEIFGPLPPKCWDLRHAASPLAYSFTQSHSVQKLWILLRMLHFRLLACFCC